MATTDLRTILESTDATVKQARKKVDAAIKKVEQDLTSLKADVKSLDKLMNDYFKANVANEGDSKWIIEAGDSVRSLAFEVNKLETTRGDLYQVKQALGRQS